MTADEIAALPSIEVFTVEDKAIAVTLRNPTTREPIDLTGSTLYFMAKASLDDEDAAAVFNETVDTFAEPTTGVATIPIDATSIPTSLEAGGELIADLVLKDAGDAVENVGIFRIILRRGVRRAIA